MDKRHFFSYIYPQAIAQFTSPYNKDIRVVLECNRYKILVGGSPQSGPYIEKLWCSAFKSFKVNGSEAVNRILILGVAGGTVISLLHNLFPRAQTTGVDIDQTMIDVGKKYFALSQISHLNLICADVRVLIRKLIEKKTCFEMVIVDLSFGREIPDFVISRTFLQNLRKIMPAGGRLIINYLREGEYQQKSNLLLDKLEKIYDAVEARGIFLNRFFFARKK